MPCALSQGPLHTEKYGGRDQPTPQVLSQETWGGAQESQFSGAFRGWGDSEKDHLRRTWTNLAVTQSVTSAWQRASKMSKPVDATALRPATSPEDREKHTNINASGQSLKHDLY